MLAIIILSSCKKEVSEFIPDNDQQLDSAWTNTISSTSQVQQLAQRLAGSLFVREINTSVDSVIRFENILSITLPAGGLTSSAGNVTGAIKAEFVLILKKGDYIRYGVPSVSNRFPLESGGAFHIRLSSSGQPVNVSTAKRMQIRYSEPEAKQGMSLYYGTNLSPVNSSLFNWLSVTPGENAIVKVWDSVNTSPVKRGYAVETFRTGWLNIDRTLEPNAIKTEVGVVVPNLFSNANTAVYLVFKNVRSVVQLSGNADQRKFSFPNIPINMDVKVVAISKVGDLYYLGVKDEKITQGLVSFVKPEVSSLEKIILFLNSL